MPAISDAERASGAATQRVAWLTDLRHEALAGVAAAIVTLPLCLSTGLLAFQPFGREIAAYGAAAGLLGATVGGFFAALAARSSFMVSSPRGSVALIQAGLATSLVAHQAFIGNLALDVLAMALCLALAGVWQIGFGALGVGRIIRFTPQPVLAGFVDGVALLIAIGAVKLLQHTVGSDWAVLPALAFAGAVAALIHFAPRVTKRLPGAIVGLLGGTAAYYGIGALSPDLPLGPTVGRVTIDVTESVRAAVAGSATYPALAATASEILLTSFVLAVVASLESLVASRVARNLATVPTDLRRLLVGQGIGNAASAAAGGIAICITPSLTISNFQAGGRTRLSAMIAASVLLASAVFAPALLGGIPLVALCGTLLATSVIIFDRWSVALLREAIGRGRDRRANAWRNLAVVAVVMIVTATTSVTAGVVVGIILSSAIFIIDMSRPLVRRRIRADAIFSRRVRPQRDGEILRRSGQARMVLELQGVMFFGNADDLCAEIEERFGAVDMVLLDFRRVADIDASAVGALQQAVSKARARRKVLLFCGVPATHRDLFDAVASEGAVFADLDTALEWMEETALREAGHSEFEELPLEELEFLHGLDAPEIETVKTYLLPMAFPAGAILCREGEEADYLWILSAGSVSLWLGIGDGQAGKRIAALPRGTIVGEIGLLEGGGRSATVHADENVTGYVIDRETFDAMLREHPRIGTKILANIARELARRLRNTSQAFAAETG